MSYYDLVYLYWYTEILVTEGGSGRGGGTGSRVEGEGVEEIEGLEMVERIKGVKEVVEVVGITEVVTPVTVAVVVSSVLDS